MGRGDLIRLAAVAAAALVLCSSAGAAVQWRLLAGGTGGGVVTSPQGLVASTRGAATAQVSSRLPDGAGAKLASVDFSRNLLVTIIGEFGCRDALIGISSVVQHGRTLAVTLVQHPPKPGIAQCQAIFTTYRFLVVSKASLSRPYPTHATVALARA